MITYFTGTNFHLKKRKLKWQKDPIILSYISSFPSHIEKIIFFLDYFIFYILNHKYIGQTYGKTFLIWIHFSTLQILQYTHPVVKTIKTTRRCVAKKFIFSRIIYHNENQSVKYSRIV